MIIFRLEPNGTIYLYHWITSKQPIKVSTRLKVEVEKWNKEKMRPKSSRYAYKGKNVTQELVRIENTYYEAWKYFQNNEDYSPIKLKQKFKELLSPNPRLSSSNESSRFLDFFSRVLEDYKITKKRDSWKGYSTTLNHLKKYFGRDIPNFEDIDMAFYSLYNKYLIGKGLSINTISTHWKCIKAIMKQAQQHRFHTNTDYLMFKRLHENSDTIYLSEEELQRIFELDLKGYQDKARDYFLIGCYTGLRFADWDQVTEEVIINDQIIIRSSKTGRKSIIPVTNNVIRILKKYSKGILPPKPSNQKLNKYIKEVAKKAGIIEPITTRITKGGKMEVETKQKYELVSTHTARRSFATIMVLNGVQSYLIMKVTGHSSLSSFEKYIRFDELQASIQLKESKVFKNTFGKALTWSEKLQYDEEFRKKRLLLLT